jgi:hypothetical protein
MKNREFQIAARVLFPILWLFLTLQCATAGGRSGYTGGSAFIENGIMRISVLTRNGAVNEILHH